MNNKALQIKQAMSNSRSKSILLIPILAFRDIPRAGGESIPTCG